MSIRELQQRKATALVEYHRITAECDADILAIRRQRDPAYDRKQREKVQKGYEGFREPGRDYIPTTPYG
jgi:hypothetical protein